MTPRRGMSWPLVIGLIGLVGVLLPSSVFELVAATGWEVEMLRFLGLTAAIVATLWPWASRQGGHSAVKLRRWSTASVMLLAVYVLSAQSLLLVMSFCLLIGALLDVGMERAELASKRLMESMERRAPGVPRD